MTVGGSKEACDLRVKLRSGASFVNIRPLFTFDSKNIIIVSGFDVKVFNIQNGECLHTLRQHKAAIVSLQECKQNPLQIFSCSEDGCVVQWDHAEGKMLKMYNLQMPVANFYAPTNSRVWYAVKKLKDPSNLLPDHYRLYSLVAKEKRISNHQLVLNPVLPEDNTIAFGFEGLYVAAVHDNVFEVMEIKTKKIKRHFTGNHTLKCVSCHPSEYVVATGDSLGRVLVWSNFLESSKPVRSIFHWHSLPVSDVAFSTEGCYIYSGGGEAALVKWNLFSDERSILPRLGATIRRVEVSPDNAYVIISQDDNSLQVVNSQRNIVQVIQGLTQGHFQGAPGKDVLLTGMLYDPLSKALVMNGRPGHLQFYNIQEDKQLFNLDISGRNFISQDRESVVLNIDVQRAAIDSEGHWLATAEYWDDEETSPQIWLKFWQFDMTKQTFVLNTNVILPHNKAMECIVFRPISDPDSSPFAVTTSQDGRFKTWVLHDDKCFEGKQSWSCLAMGCYRDLVSGDACFSEDGSLLAVAFDSVATLWMVDSTTLTAALSREKNTTRIAQLVFGRQSCSHLLVCQDGVSITVWNVVSLSIHWIVHVNVQTLVADSMSDIMAAFCEEQTLILFKASHPDPVFSLENVSKEPVIAAIFVPKRNDKPHNTICFHDTSQLFFFNENQNLLVLTDECEDDVDDSQKIIIKQNIPKTPFGRMQPEFRVSNVEKQNILNEPLPLDTVSNNKGKIEITCPTLVDPVTLCARVLKSLLIPIKREVEESKPIQETPIDSVTDRNLAKSENVKADYIKVSDFSFLLKSVNLTTS